MSDPSAHTKVGPVAEPIRMNDLWVTPHAARMVQDNDLDSVDALFAIEGGTVLSKSGLDTWRTRVRLSVADGDHRATWYVKRYDHPPAGEQRTVERAANGARSLAGVEWYWTRYLRERGIPCPEPIALGEEFRGTREVRSVLVTAEAGGDALERIAPARKTPLPLAVVQRLAQIVCALHSAGVVHRDLYLSHVFMKPDDETGASLMLIDLQRLLRPGSCRRRWFVKDLAALNYSTPSVAVSRTTRLRFVRWYLGKDRLDRDARQLIYLVEGKTGQIGRHEQRRSRRSIAVRTST